MVTVAAMLIGIASVFTLQPLHLAAASADSPAQSSATAPKSGDDRGHDHGDDRNRDRGDDRGDDRGHDHGDDEGPDDTIVSPPVTVPDSSTPIFFGVIAAAVLTGASLLAVRRSRRQPAQRG